MDEKVVKASEESQHGPSRSTDEVALDMMKFIAVTTGYGKTTGGGTAGFSPKPSLKGPEEYAEALITLFERCRKAVLG